MAEMKSDENKILAALGYPIFVVALVVLLTDMKKNAFMRLHAVQALGLFVAYVIIRVALGILFSVGLWSAALLGWIVLWVWLVVAVFYGYKAYQGQTFSIPFITDMTKKYASM